MKAYQKSQNHTRCKSMIRIYLVGTDVHWPTHQYTFVTVGPS